MQPLLIHVINCARAFPAVTPSGLCSSQHSTRADWVYLTSKGKKCANNKPHLKMVQVYFLILSCQCFKLQAILSPVLPYDRKLFVQWLYSAICSLIYNISQSDGLVQSGFCQLQGCSNQTAERQKLKLFFSPVFSLRLKSQKLQCCGQKNGKNKLKQIGKAPVFPRTIWDQHFSNQ